MKKSLIIGLIVAAAIWLLLLPAAVGLFLNDRAPGWLEGEDRSLRQDFAPGWFTSRLQASDGESYWLRLRARHLPPLGQGWFRVRGELTTPFSGQPLNLTGRLRLDGETDIEIEGHELTVLADPAVQSSSARIQANRNRRGATRIDLDLAGLSLHDALGNRLYYDLVEGLVSWRQRGNGLASAGLQLSFDGLEGLRLTLEAESMNMVALAELRDGLEQLRAAPPDSVDQRLAALGIAAAWQQINASGLAVTLHEFGLGPHTRFQGQWNARQRQPDITGQGRVAALMEGLAPLVGLIRGLDPVESERQTANWIQTLVEGGWLRIDGAEFEFRYPPPSGELNLPLPGSSP